MYNAFGAITEDSLSKLKYPFVKNLSMNLGLLEYGCMIICCPLSKYKNDIDKGIKLLCSTEKLGSASN